MGATILGLGTASPRYAMQQSEAARASAAFCCDNDRQARLLENVYRRSGILTRGSVVLEEPNGKPIRQSFFLPSHADDAGGPPTSSRMQRYAEEAAPLAIAASTAALREAGVQAARITHLVTVSCTGFSAPGVDIRLIKALGLPATVARTHVGFMGCHGAMNGLRVASALAAQDPDARVLLCAVELCSLHFQYGWDLERVTANALFADGAAAVVLVPEAGPEGRQWRLAASGSCIFPDSEDAMSWSIGDHGFVMTLSPRVPDLIRSGLRVFLEPWLSSAGLRFDEIGSWAVHPGGPRILSSVAAALELDESALATSREVLAENGNMSSPTILFILNRMRRQVDDRPCVALGFGPGLAAEVALLV